MRVLFVSPTFFGYEEEIAKEFEVQGHEVTFVDERPSNSAFKRATVRVAPLLLNLETSRHYRETLERVKRNGFDCVLIIKGEVVPSWFLEDLRRINPRATFVYYTFDSFVNSPRGMRVARQCDRRFTFDRSDADRVSGFEYEPLFYCPEYYPQLTPRRTCFSFVGTLHGDRFAFTQAITERFPSESAEFRYFVPAAWYFWISKATKKEYARISRSMVTTHPLGRAKVAELTRQSKVIIDVQRKGQVGLTMRTFEALAAGSSIITTNTAIEKEEFFSDDRVLVVPNDPHKIDVERLQAFVNRQPEVGRRPPAFEEHSLAAWVNRMAEALGEGGHVR